MTSVVKSVPPPGAPVSWNMPNRLPGEVLAAIVPDVDVAAEMPQSVVPVSEEYLVPEAAGGVQSKSVLSCNGGGLPVPPGGGAKPKSADHPGPAGPADGYCTVYTTERDGIIRHKAVGITHSADILNARLMPVCRRRSSLSRGHLRDYRVQYKVLKPLCRLAATNKYTLSANAGRLRPL